MSPPKCRSCRARIRWVRTAAHGKPLPLDPKPDLAGNVIMSDGLAVVLGKDSPELDQARADPDVAVWQSHWATCPNRDRHRKESSDKA